MPSARKSRSSTLVFGLRLIFAVFLVGPLCVQGEVVTVTFKYFAMGFVADFDPSGRTPHGEVREVIGHLMGPPLQIDKLTLVPLRNGNRRFTLEFQDQNVSGVTFTLNIEFDANGPVSADLLKYYGILPGTVENLNVAAGWPRQWSRPPQALFPNSSAAGSAAGSSSGAAAGTADPDSAAPCEELLSDSDRLTKKYEGTDWSR
ncbi:MAG: hypothetical protein AB7P49_14105, partial [Bdellovibrionales bacterium]